MNYRPLIPLAALLLGATACQAPPVDHNHAATPTSITLPAPSTTTSTTSPTSDLKGNYCWTEKNTFLPEGVEGLCGRDLSKVPTPAAGFLHWGMPSVGDYEKRICKGDGMAECPLAGDDNKDGRIDEDESGFDCHTMGNHICGKGSI